LAVLLVHCAYDCGAARAAVGDGHAGYNDGHNIVKFDDWGYVQPSTGGKSNDAPGTNSSAIVL
jgi:hypothetical protein